MTIIMRDLAHDLTNAQRGFKAPELAKYVLEHKLMAELVNLCFAKDALLSSRAMWVLSWCSGLNQNSIDPYHDKLIKNLETKNLHKGVVRNTLRLYQNRPVPDKHRAFLLDACYAYVKDPTEAIAVRAFAITVVFNISKPYPELLHELEQVLNRLPLQEEMPAIRSRIKNTLRQMHKLKE